MRKTDHLTRKQIRELMNQPMTVEEAETLKRIRESDLWLFALNLQKMDCAEASNVED